MRRCFTIGLLGLFCWTPLFSQVSYLNRPDLLEKVEEGLHNTYNFAFDEAREIQKELVRTTPHHPAPLFLEALIIYWEHFPLMPDDPASEQFVHLMDRTVELAEDLVENEETYQEGIFFDLFGRAFKAMFWADNGKSGKVVPDLGTMYRHTKEGKELKDQFVEFYFSTGLYNYYVEAYPEAHPIYKPLLSFMQEGDKQLGLEQLNHAINHAVFLKVEALLFMSLIQLKYEKDLQTAAIYARRLHRDYPENLYYQGHLITVLLHQHRYDAVREILVSMERQKDSWSAMIRTLANAFITEKQTGNDILAGQGYQELVELADSFGPFADVYAAMAYMGLSRLHEQKGLESEARRYARKASKHTVYRFILDE
ncbi:MAG: hypothetical protein KAR16_04375 [Bacteroidales bacterium]|nr:hypothetical protein [Bacteroidales bacterium]